MIRKNKRKSENIFIKREHEQAKIKIRLRRSNKRRGRKSIKHAEKEDEDMNKVRKKIGKEKRNKEKKEEKELVPLLMRMTVKWVREVEGRKKQKNGRTVKENFKKKKQKSIKYMSGKNNSN